tara:strand:+ start:477 stop:737 length:261 start_codon:yes stop_codon:yes gene_type:complete
MMMNTRGHGHMVEDEICWFFHFFTFLLKKCKKRERISFTPKNQNIFFPFQLSRVREKKEKVGKSIEIATLQKKRKKEACTAALTTQ